MGSALEERKGCIVNRTGEIIRGILEKTDKGNLGFRSTHFVVMPLNTRCMDLPDGNYKIKTRIGELTEIKEFTVNKEETIQFGDDELWWLVEFKSTVQHH
jgi:hypothetical protein|tara:strand:- start:186 stop:485 length:300 start_codon:yes stop_codon:yes gene_type:complete